MVCWLIVLPPLSLNSIAYRRVIYVYQYQVADDLSGRSFSPSLARFFFFFFCFLWHSQSRQSFWCFSIRGIGSTRLNLVPGSLIVPSPLNCINIQHRNSGGDGAAGSQSVALLQQGDKFCSSRDTKYCWRPKYWWNFMTSWCSAVAFSNISVLVQLPLIPFKTVLILLTNTN